MVPTRPSSFTTHQDEHSCHLFTPFPSVHCQYMGALNTSRQSSSRLRCHLPRECHECYKNCLRRRRSC